MSALNLLLETEEKRLWEAALAVQQCHLNRSRPNRAYKNLLKAHQRFIAVRDARNCVNEASWTLNSLNDTKDALRWSQLRERRLHWNKIIASIEPTEGHRPLLLLIDMVLELADKLAPPEPSEREVRNEFKDNLAFLEKKGDSAT